jgi:hypothetical protein
MILLSVLRGRIKVVYEEEGGVFPYASQNNKFADRQKRNPVNGDKYINYSS